MIKVRVGPIAGLSLLPGFLALAPAFAQQGDALPLDVPRNIAGIEAVCTGVGLDAREDPRWDAYSLKVEIAGAGGRYLGDEHVVLRQGGKEIAAVSCGGPWLLFRLPPGRYEVQAQIGGQSANSAAFVPATGQGRIILRFAEDGSP